MLQQFLSVTQVQIASGGLRENDASIAVNALSIQLPAGCFLNIW